MCPPKGTKRKDKQTGRSLDQNERGFINYDRLDPPKPPAPAATSSKVGGAGPRSVRARERLEAERARNTGASSARTRDNQYEPRSRTTLVRRRGGDGAGGDR